MLFSSPSNIKHAWNFTILASDQEQSHVSFGSLWVSGDILCLTYFNDLSIHPIFYKRLKPSQARPCQPDSPAPGRQLTTARTACSSEDGNEVTSEDQLSCTSTAAGDVYLSTGIKTKPNAPTQMLVATHFYFIFLEKNQRFFKGR